MFLEWNIEKLPQKILHYKAKDSKEQYFASHILQDKNRLLNGDGK
jgi:hypothetical protein